MNAPSADSLTVDLLERMLAANPRDGGAWSTLGVLLRRTGQLHAAAACHRRGVEFDPNHGGIWSNLGNVLTEIGDYAEACAAHEQAFRLSPDAPSTLFNYAITLRKAGRFGRAVEMLEKGLALEPGNASLQWEAALSRLQVGDYAAGFADYEARLRIPSYRNRIPPGMPWDGSPLDGRTLFVSTEQGFGDALLMTRYLPLLKRSGGRVILECHPELMRVLSGLEGVDAFLPAGASLPGYDVHASLMGLPRLLGTTADTVPPPVRLTVPDDAHAKAEGLLGTADGAFRVGIVWSGRVTFADNTRRATSLDRFLRFIGVPGVQLYSLQKGPPEEQLAKLGTSKLIVPLGPHLNDFAETAAVIERLDLVLMTDSSVAHLAGSLGKPVWNLVQCVPYWIYGCEGDRTPWYPSMRLFRQGLDEDWDPVFAAARAALTEAASAKARAAEPVA
ncbi:tetratricopeptide repeat protein [Azospirillum doebereinerae]